MTTASDKLMQMLMSEDRHGSATPGPEVREYDWESPSSFTPAQNRACTELATLASAKIQQSLNKLLRAELDMGQASSRLLYGRGVQRLAAESHYNCLPLIQNAGVVGVLMLPVAMANSLVARFLGASKDTGDHQMSTLEQSLLDDIIKVIANELSAALSSAGGKMQLQVGASSAELPKEIISQECCLMTLSSEMPSLLVAVPCNLLEGCLGAASSGPTISSQELRRRLLAHLDRGLVRGTVWIGQAQLTMRDVLSIEVGDVIPLTTWLKDPVELVCHNQQVALGLITRIQDHYALQITRRS